MAPVLLPRIDIAPPKGTGISTSAAIGIAVVGVAVVCLITVLAVLYFRWRCRSASTSEPMQRTVQHPSTEKGIITADLHMFRSPGSLTRSVSRHNLTPSVVLPTPVPPIPAARPRPRKNAVTASRPFSNAEVLAHHEATGTMPRAFSPITPSAISPRHALTPSPGPFSFALNAPSTRPSLNRTASPVSKASFHTAPSRPGSVVSISRLSVLSTSLRSSFSSRSSAGTAGAGSEPLKVHHVFTPLLPDELVLLRGERVRLVQMYDDGWYIVGRRAAWAPKKPASNGAQYAFGHATAHSAPDEVELGAVPAWVFQKGGNAQERPMRSESLGVTLVLSEDESVGDREKIASWSNF